MKSICEKIRNRLAEDGPQAFREDNAAQEHLAECDDCFAFLEALNELEGELRDLPAMDAPDETVEALLARPEFAAPGESKGFFEWIRSRIGTVRPRYAIVGSAAAAVLLLVVFVGNPADVFLGMERSGGSVHVALPYDQQTSVVDSLEADPSNQELPKLGALGYVADAEAVERSLENAPEGSSTLEYREGPRLGGEDRDSTSRIVVRKGYVAPEKAGADKNRRADHSEVLNERFDIVAQTDRVELDSTATETKFSDEFIEDLPVPDRFYQNVLTLAPGVQDADGDGNPNVHGSRERDFKSVVSGVSNVQEIEVITSGAGAESGRTQDGFANLRVLTEGEEEGAKDDYSPREKQKKQNPPPTGPLIAGGSPVVAPVLIEESYVAPRYPRRLRGRGIEAKVWLQVIVDSDGGVEEATVLKSDHESPLFGRKAIEAVEEWRYRPATVDGKPVRVIFTELIEFKPDSSAPESRVAPSAGDESIELARAFLTERTAFDGLQRRPADGYWANTYLPGDPTARLLQARLAGWDRAERLHDASHRIGQPFDTPQSSALAIYLHADRRSIEGKSRLLVQVGLKGTPRHAGRRPLMNLGLVLDLTGPVDADVAIGIRSLLEALNQAKQPGDRFSVFVAGRSGGLLVEPQDFRHGFLQVTLDRLLDDSASETDPAMNVVDALSTAIHAISSDDDPRTPLGSSGVMLVTGGELGPQSRTLASLAHQSAVAGVPVSVVGIGSGVEHSEIDLVALAGQGRRRLFEDPQSAVDLVDRELSAATRAIARAVRLRIRLAPGVELIDVIGSDRLDEARSQQVRDAEKSIDLRLSRNLGIEADRGEDEDGIQIVIPSFYAGDTHVVLLDVVAPGPGPVADVTVRYKDLVQLRNGVGRAGLALDGGSEVAGPLEHNVLKNLLSHRLGETLEQAGRAVADGEIARADEMLDEFRSLLSGLRVELPGLDNDPEIAADIAMLGDYRTLLLAPSFTEQPARLARLSDSLRFAAHLKVQPRPLEKRS